MNGITFGNYHSYDDFNLILSQKRIGTPSPKTYVVDIAGGDGVIDLSEYFGEIKYQNRILSFDFSTKVPKSQFMDLFSEVQNALHGKKMHITLDEDAGFYYIGRISVSEWQAEKNIGKITIECDCEPWKYKQSITRPKVVLQGKNIFDANNFEQGNILTTIGEKYSNLKTNSSSRLRAKVLQYVKPSTRYTLTIPSGFECAVRNFDADERQLSVSAWWPEIYSFTTASNADSISLYIRKASGGTIRPSDIVDIGFQLEEGNEATEFEPYVEETTISVALENLNKNVIPIIRACGSVTIEYEGASIAMAYSSGMFPAIRFHQGICNLTITGNGVVVFEYQEGGL